MGCGASAQDQDDDHDSHGNFRRSSTRKATPWFDKASSKEGLTLSQQLSAGGKLGADNDSDSEGGDVQVAKSAADEDRRPLPEGAVAIFLDWSTCEFDIAMPDTLRESPLTEDMFDEFMWILNFELLDSFVEKWRADAAASLAKSVLQKTVKRGAKELCDFVMPLPGKVVLGAIEQVGETIRQKMRRQDWDGRVVPQLKLWLAMCDEKAEGMGAKLRFEYLDAVLTPVQLADLEARRRRANSLLKLADAQESTEEQEVDTPLRATSFDSGMAKGEPEAERGRLRELAAAFNGNVEDAQARMDEARDRVEDKVDELELPGSFKETLSEAASTRLPCVLFVLPA